MFAASRKTMLCPADTNTKNLLSFDKRFFVGGEQGIRTLETLLTFTRFPIVLLRPARTTLHTVKSIGFSIAALFGRFAIIHNPARKIKG